MATVLGHQVEQFIYHVQSPWTPREAVHIPRPKSLDTRWNSSVTQGVDTKWNSSFAISQCVDTKWNSSVTQGMDTVGTVHSPYPSAWTQVEQFTYHNPVSSGSQTEQCVHREFPTNGHQVLRKRNAMTEFTGITRRIAHTP